MDLFIVVVMGVGAIVSWLFWSAEPATRKYVTSQQAIDAMSIHQLIACNLVTFSPTSVHMDACLLNRDAEIIEYWDQHYRSAYIYTQPQRKVDWLHEGF